MSVFCLFYIIYFSILWKFCDIDNQVCRIGEKLNDLLAEMVLRLRTFISL